MIEKLTKSQELLDRRKECVANGVGVFNTATVQDAKGAIITDVDGRELIDFAGGITKAITMTKEFLKQQQLSLPIVVEARDLDEITEILKNNGVHRILIDNFNYTDTQKAIDLIGDQCLTESSGGIDEVTLRHYAECGVNYISCGALTHSVSNMDLSLKAV